MGCPTCLGRLEKNTPPFFSDEYWQEAHKKARLDKKIHYIHEDEDLVDDTHSALDSNNNMEEPS